MATLVELFEHQKRPELVEVLRAANSSIELTDYDNWNGGTSTWALQLDIPVSIFAVIEPRLQEVEKEIGKKLSYLDRLYPNDHLGSVVISPLAGSATTSVTQAVASERDVRRLWPIGKFRLFLSHVSKYKVEVAQLKLNLGQFGIAAFLAHEDIEPSLEWQNEIELALGSMHALAALVTQDFGESDWTDQEVGWALGRGVPVIPVRLGANPYGLAGKVQAVAGDLNNPSSLAESIVTVLRKNRGAHGEMKRALVSAFEEVQSYADAKKLSNHLVKIDDFTDDEGARIKRACLENGQIKDAFGVVAKIERRFGSLPAPAPVPPADDDLPF